MNKIHLMDEQLTNKIAAGEVIERPLSVVKELIENSVDANATEISVILLNSGIKSILIKDNGEGMSKEDLKLSIKRHATSKLISDKELFKISTLGFRGEALASIHSISKMKLYTSIDGISGYLLENDSIKEYPTNKGTSIEVNSLFYNTPARYTHLSSEQYELSLIVKYINKLSLIHPNIKFNLLNNDKELINTSGNNNIQDIFLKQYNRDLVSKLMHINTSSENFSIDMYISHPQDTRSNRDGITLSLNNRLVNNYQIIKSIMNGYGHYLHTNQYPIIYINIDVDY
ncbi:MAG: DNA mismatch repair endonuclease MutL [Mycoplasmatales bacterium]